MLLASACSDAPQGLTPTAPATVPDRPDLVPLRGRWSPLTTLPDGTVAVLQGCKGTTVPFVEVRGDPIEGWELVSGEADTLRIGRIGKVETGDGRVTMGIDGEDAVEVRWVEPGKTATFPTLFADRTFVVPGGADGFAVAPAPGCDQ